MKIVFFLILSLVANAQTYNVFSRLDSCQAHWVFDSTYAAYKGKYVLYDYTGNGNDFTFASSGDGYTAKLTSDNSFIPSGKVVDPVPADLDRMIIYDPSADFADIDATESLTIVGRHKHAATTRQFFAKRASTVTGAAGYMIEQRASGVFRFYCSDGTDAVNTPAITMGWSDGTSNAWAIVLDRSTSLVRFYANGDSVGVHDFSAVTLDDLTSVQPLVIYNNSGLSATYFDNPVHEIQIYNVALTSSQIAVIHANTEVVVSTAVKRGFGGYAEGVKWLGW